MVGWQGAALAAAALVLSGCAAFTGSFGTVEAPEWQPGFRFTFETESESRLVAAAYEDGEKVRSEEESESDSGTFARTLDVVGLHEQDGASYFVAIESHDIRGQSMTRLVATRASDLGEVQASIASGKLTVHDRDPEGGDGLVRFPLSAGDRYTYGGEWPSPLTSVRVAGMERVDGPDGKVDAVRIEHTPDSKAMLAMMAEDLAGDYGSEDAAEADVDGSWEAEMVLFYAPSLRQVVLKRIDVTLDLDIRFTEDGVARRHTMEGEFHVVERLAKASLEPRPALSLPDIEKILRGEASIGPPLVPPPQPSGDPSLTLGLPTGPVTIGQTGAIPVKVGGSGLSEPVTVKLLLDGTTVTQASGRVGTELKLPVSAAGVYSVTAVTNGDDPRLSDTGLVAVDATFEVPATCPLVGSPVEAPCTPFALQVAPGVERVRLTVLRQAVAVEPGLGTVTLTGPGGSEEKLLTGSQAFAEAEGKPGAWEAKYAPIGLPGGITYRLELTATELPDPQSWPLGRF